MAGGPAPPKAEEDLLDRIRTVRAGDVAFKFGFEERVRVEHWNNEDLDSGLDDRDTRTFARTRIRMDTVFNKWLQTRVELVDGREWESDREPRPQNDDLDLHQAYAQVNLKPWMLRLGRQEVEFGSKRLVGAPTWNNLLRSFDAARLSFDADAAEVHAFAGSVVVNEDDRFNRRRHHDWLFGVFSTIKALGPHKLDLYALALRNHNKLSQVTGEDRVKGHHDCDTFGARLYGKLTERWTYDVEAAVQRGRYSNDRIRAWAFHADTAYTLPLPWQPTIQPLFNYASGDNDPGDGVRGTFDPLFTSTHNVYGGIMDLVTWMNIRVAGVRVRAKPAKKLTVAVEFHRYWLAEDADAWYATGKRVRRRDAAGNSGDDIGYEVGFWARYAFSQRFEVEGGLAHFHAGGFPDRTGASDGMDFCYFQTVLKCW